MFEPTSRYAGLPIRTHVEDGREIPCVTRRIITDNDTPTIGHLTVRQADRADHLAHEAYGDSAQWWRLGDRNRADRAEDLVTPVGRLIDVPMPTPNPTVA